MRIAIIASGSRGDVQPYLALGQGLQQAGHDVRLVTHEDFADLVTAHGVAFWPIGGTVKDIAQSDAMSAQIDNGNFISMMALMAREAKRGAVIMAEGCLAGCQGVDLVITGIGGLHVGIAVAEKLGLPLLQAYYIPFTPTRAFPSFVVPPLPSALGSLLNPLSFRIARQMMWQGFRSADRLARQQVLDMPAAPFMGPFNSPRFLREPVLYCYSPAVIPKPADWSDGIQVTGYWFLQEANGWTPPPALQQFLEDGPPPIFVGFGSMSSRNAAETADIVLQAVSQSGQRAVLLSGWGGLKLAELPDNVLAIESAPFSWLFPRMAAVVHHGGAGTTSAGLRAGVPSIVIPFFGDQPYWGQRVAALGVGPMPIPRKKLTTDNLTQAIQTAVNDDAMRRRAAALGARIGAEDGVARAVEVIEQIKI